MKCHDISISSSGYDMNPKDIQYRPMWNAEIIFLRFSEFPVLVGNKYEWICCLCTELLLFGEFWDCAQKEFLPLCLGNDLVSIWCWVWVGSAEPLKVWGLGKGPAHPCLRTALQETFQIREARPTLKQTSMYTSSYSYHWLQYRHVLLILHMCLLSLID